MKGRNRTIFMFVLVIGSLFCSIGHANSREVDGHVPDIITLTPEEMKEFGVTVEIARDGVIKKTLTLTGEVMLNRDSVANVVSMVPGVVQSVKKFVGDHVEKGETMAVIQSRELADAKSAYLAARERLNLAKLAFKREETLWKKKISSQQDYLNAKQALANAKIEMRSSAQKLLALGFSPRDLEHLKNGGSKNLAAYEIRSPISGTVIEKYISLGEAVDSYGRLYQVADLSTVWVDLDVYQKDLAKIKKGLTAMIFAADGLFYAKGTIGYVGPILSEQTRTAIARIVLENRDGNWRPGLFVTALVEIGQKKAHVRVRKSAVQEMDGRKWVFVETDKGFSPREIVTGDADYEYVEVLSGLRPGERYVSKGASILKFELQKESFGSDEH